MSNASARIHLKPEHAERAKKVAEELSLPNISALITILLVRYSDHLKANWVFPATAAIAPTPTAAQPPLQAKPFIPSGFSLSESPNLDTPIEL